MLNKLGRESGLGNTKSVRWAEGTSKYDTIYIVGKMYLILIRNLNDSESILI